VTRIAVESWMPGHQEMKRMPFVWCFHNAQLAISSNDGVPTSGYGNHEFCARKALQSHSEVRQSNTRSAFGADSRSPKRLSTRDGANPPDRDFSTESVTAGVHHLCAEQAQALGESCGPATCVRSLATTGAASQLETWSGHAATRGLP
jgi:hypothetical protein